MTENAPRRIEGLQPRATAPLARLLKSERDAAPAEPTPEPAVTDATPSGTRQPASATKPRGRKASPATAGRKPSATFYIPEALQVRGRAAFRHTQNLEGDESYSHMVAKAYEAEVQRRETLYNDGKPFSGGGPLPAGRPLQG